MCLNDCPSSGQSDPDDEEEDSNSVEGSNGSGEGDFHDYDQDDWDAIEELELLRDHSRLESDSYSRFEQEDLKLLQLNKKKKQLHKHLWDRHQREISRIMIKESDEKSSTIGSQGDLSAIRGNSVTFMSYSDPTANRDRSCTNDCGAQFACGTELAPQYAGPDIVKNPDA
ncbi:hypothetical protein BGZ83_008505 [Gryganskiella cystojenkinii]|nr:hypothetical protein BGZ83_008505 [Gryganskiella cystojenkinii]